MQAIYEDFNSEYDLLDDLSMPPEKILEVLVHDFRHRSGSVEASLYSLQLERATVEAKRNAVEKVVSQIQQIRNILDDTLTYVEKRKTINDWKGDTES